MGRRNFLLVLSYEGGGFFGWQRLPDGSRTVQAVVEKALGEVLGEPGMEITGAGRTDRGVHAEGQAASFHSRTALACADIAACLDAALPDDVACLSCTEVDPRFHARFRARSKLYRYRLPAGVTRNLDLDEMRYAAGLLTGERDFRFLSNEREKTDTLRRVDAIRIEEAAAPGAGGRCIDLLFEGPGFLHNQVRVMAALILAAGQGKFGRGQAGRTALNCIMASGDRTRVPGALAAHGLTLMEVRYSGYGFDYRADARSSADSTRRTNSAR